MMTRPAREPARAGGFGSRRTSQYEPRPRRRDARPGSCGGPPRAGGPMTRCVTRRLATTQWTLTTRATLPSGAPASRTRGDHVLPRPAARHGAPRAGRRSRRTASIRSSSSPTGRCGRSRLPFLRERGPEELALKCEPKVECVRPTAAGRHANRKNRRERADTSTRPAQRGGCSRLRGFDGGACAGAARSTPAGGRSRASGRAGAHTPRKVERRRRGATAFRACAQGGSYAFFLAVRLILNTVARRRADAAPPVAAPPPVEIACDHEDRRLGEPTVAVARCCDGSVVAGGRRRRVPVEAGTSRRAAAASACTAASSSPRRRRARRARGRRAARAAPRSRTPPVRRGRPAPGAGKFSSPASRPPAPVEARAGAAPPYAAPPPWAPQPRPAPAAPIDARTPALRRLRAVGTPARPRSAARGLARGLRGARTTAAAPSRGAAGTWRAHPHATEVIDRGDGVYVVRARAAPPEVGDRDRRRPRRAQWRATVVADERPISLYVKSDLRLSLCQFSVKRYGVGRALRPHRAKTGVAPRHGLDVEVDVRELGRQPLWAASSLLWDERDAGRVRRKRSDALPRGPRGPAADAAARAAALRRGRARAATRPPRARRAAGRSARARGGISPPEAPAPAPELAAPELPPPPRRAGARAAARARPAPRRVVVDLARPDRSARRSGTRSTRSSRGTRRPS